MQHQSYTCSFLSNGRDAFCTQGTYSPRGDVETALLAGIKAQPLSPKVAKQRARQVQAAAQKRAGVDGKAELAALDRQIADLADTILAVGRSDVLTEVVLSTKYGASFWKSRSGRGEFDGGFVRDVNALLAGSPFTATQ